MRDAENPKLHAHRHTKQHIRRCSSSGDKLVRKAGDKRPRAHCPGIREEQRCENVTTNSPWSPNVTFPLYSTPLPARYSVLLPPLSYLTLSVCFLCTSSFFFYHILLFSSLPSSAPVSSANCMYFSSSPQKGREGKSKKMYVMNVFLTAPLASSLIPFLHLHYLLFLSFFIQPYPFICKWISHSIHSFSISISLSMSEGQ